MPTINLRDLYPTLYTTDEWIDISNEIAELFLADKRWEAARLRRMYYHKAQYSLDCHDGMENDIITFPETPDEAYEKYWHGVCCPRYRTTMKAPRAKQEAGSQSQSQRERQDERHNGTGEAGKRTA